LAGAFLEDHPMTVATRYAVTPLGSALGAEVVGLDAAHLSADDLAAVKRLFLEHHLLVFRDQHLSDADIQRFAESFGAIEENQVKGTKHAVHAISNVGADGRPSANPMLKTNYSWHTDKAYLKTPALMTLLWGEEIPPVGGDTQFANVEMAYDDLPESTKRRIDKLRVIQSFDYMLDTLNQRHIIEPNEIPPPVEHPLVRTHPETGRRSLFACMYTSHVVGMPADQSRALLDELVKHSTQDKYVVTHIWKKHDFVVWDNRSLLHRAIPNYDMGAHRRVLRRSVVRGGVPQ
jgi:taurine dioxygenase